MFPNDTTKQTIHPTKQKPNPFPNPSLKPISITSETQPRKAEGGYREVYKKIIEGDRKRQHKTAPQNFHSNPINLYAKFL
jgi:hypothetical protein